MKKKMTVSAGLSMILTFWCMSGSAATANYSVPVSADLAQFATFKLINFSANFDHGEKAKMKFQLPPELIGTDSYRIEFEEVGRPSVEPRKVLVSEHGTAVCEKGFCNLTYRNLPDAFAGAEKFLKNTIREPAELAARLKVAKAFSGDPIGTIEIIPDQYTAVETAQ